MQLQVIQNTLGQVNKEVTRLANHVGKQNHRLDKIERAQVKELGRQEGLAEANDKLAQAGQLHTASLKWWFVTGLGAAGVLSGAVFKVLELIGS